MRIKPYNDPSVRYTLEDSAPTNLDTNYQVSTIWIDQSTNNVFELTNVIGGSATWVQLTIGDSFVVVYNNSDIVINLLETDLNRILLVDNAAAVNINLPLGAAEDIGSWIRINKMGAGNLTINANGTDVIEDSVAGGNITNTVPTQTFANIGLFLGRSDTWKFLGAPIGSWSTT